MAMLQAEIGQKIRVNAQFTKTDAYGTPYYYDPTTVKITIEYKDETDKVTNQDMSKSETGKYYYEVQTDGTWLKGRYQVTVTSTGSPNDVTFEPRCFNLS